jgi:hypothetical protein
MTPNKPTIPNAINTCIVDTAIDSRLTKKKAIEDFMQELNLFE